MLNLAIILTFLLGFKTAYQGSDLLDYYDTFFGDYVIRHVRHEMPACDDDKLMTMLANIQIVNPENIVDLAVEHLPSICQKLESNIHAMEDYLRSCKPSNEGELYISLIKGVKKLSQILCKDGKLKPLYKEASDCIQKLNYKICQGPPDWNENSDDKKICQAYIKIINCYKESTDKKCGKNAGIVMHRVIKGVVSSVLPVLCEAINTEMLHDYNEFSKHEDTQVVESLEDTNPEVKAKEKEKLEEKTSQETTADSDDAKDEIKPQQNADQTTETKIEDVEEAQTNKYLKHPEGPSSAEEHLPKEMHASGGDSKQASVKGGKFQSKDNESHNKDKDEADQQDDSGNQDNNSGRTPEGGENHSHHNIEPKTGESVKNQHGVEGTSDGTPVRDDQEPLEDDEEDDLNAPPKKLILDSTPKGVESRNETQIKLSGRLMVLLGMLWLVDKLS